MCFAGKFSLRMATLRGEKCRFKSTRRRMNLARLDPAALSPPTVGEN